MHMWAAKIYDFVWNALLIPLRKNYNIMFVCKKNYVVVYIKYRETNNSWVTLLI